MILPENGSVVVIDDREEEALPIIKAFSKKGIPTTYYRGIKQDELPDKPCQVVRLAIVDLQLIQGETNAHTIATRLINILKKIIAENNGPFLLLIWSTKDALFADTLKQEIKKIEHRIVPALIVTLDKLNCLEKDNSASIQKEEIIKNILEQLTPNFEDEDISAIKKSLNDNIIIEDEVKYKARQNAIETVETEIKKALQNAGVFHLFVIWENLVRQSASQTVYLTSDTIAQDSNWEHNMRDVFRRMGIARVGKNVKESKELLKESILTLVQSFTDRLESGIKLQSFPDNIALDSGDLLKMVSGSDEYLLKKEPESFSVFKNGTRLFQGGGLDKLTSSINKHQNPTEKKAGLDIVSYFENIPSKLNTGLHLELNPSMDLMPGNIYGINVNQENASQLLKSYFKTLPKDIQVVQFVELEVSPICDYAQAKWKKSRLISGILFPENIDPPVKVNDHHYEVSPVFSLEGGAMKMVFDCHLFKALDNSVVAKRTVKYRLKREILLDIIAKVSSHVNRPGITFIE